MWRSSDQVANTAGMQRESFWDAVHLILYSAWQGASTQSIASRRAADSEKADMLSKLRSTAQRSHGASRGGAQSSAGRRTFSLRKNLSQHLDLGTAAVPTSTRLPAAGLNGQAGSQDDGNSPLAPAQSDTTDGEEVWSQYSRHQWF